jgi:hypothetical protein
MQDKAELNNNSSHYINNFNNPTNGTSVLKNNLVELPLPSKNQHIGKRIVKKLLIESENVVSKTQFNARSPNNNNYYYYGDDDEATSPRDYYNKVCLIFFFLKKKNSFMFN